MILQTTQTWFSVLTYQLINSISRNPALSSVLCRCLAHSWYTYVHAGKPLTHIKIHMLIMHKMTFQSICALHDWVDRLSYLLRHYFCIMWFSTCFSGAFWNAMGSFNFTNWHILRYCFMLSMCSRVT